jgi:hypothetical protein
MTEFENWKADERFISCEAHCVPIMTAKYALRKLVLLRCFWLNPPGKESSRVSIVVPVLSETKRKFEQRTMVVGWRCAECKRVLFGACIEDLMHAPCCGKEGA